MPHSKIRRRPAAAADQRETPRVFAAAGPYLLVAVVALVARLIYLGEISSSPFAGTLLGDSIEYDRWARDILTGAPHRHVVFYQAPLYPYFLALVYRCGLDTWWTTSLVQAMLSVLTCLLVTWTSGQIFDRRVGLIAGLFMALNPTVLFFDAVLQKTVLDVLLAALTMAAVAGVTVGKGRWWTWALLGGAVGLWALSRENALLLVALLLIWPWWKFSPPPARHPLAANLLVLAGLAGVLFPVAYRNSSVGGQWALTTSQFGPNLYIGNSPHATGSYVPLLPGRGTVEYERIDATRLATQATGQTLSPQAVSAYWVRQALDFVRQQPLRWFALMARKCLLVVNARELADTDDQYAYADFSSLLGLLGQVGHFGLLFPLAMMGVALTAGEWRRLSIWYALPLVYAASVVVFFVFARYRAPLIPLLIPFAALAVLQIAVALRDGKLRPLAVPALVAAAAALLAMAPSLKVHDRATNWFNLAVEMEKRGDRDAAFSYYGRALRINPQYAEAYVNLGSLLIDAGNTIEGMKAYETALKYQPNSADAYTNLGLALIRLGNFVEAEAYLRRAVELNPHLAQAQYNLANVLRQRFAGDETRRGEIFEHYRLGVECDPNDALAWLNYGVALFERQRMDESLAAYDQALTLEPDMFAAHFNRGNTLRELRQFDAAQQAYQQAGRIAPESFRPTYGLALLAFDRGQCDQALAQLQQALSMIPPDQQGDRQLVEQAYRNILANQRP